jgi:hypothetical protein
MAPYLAESDGTAANSPAIVVNPIPKVAELSAKVKRQIDEEGGKTIAKVLPQSLYVPRF